MTDATDADFGAAQQAVLGPLAADGAIVAMGAAVSPPAFVERVVEYSFMELAQHRARLRSSVFSVPGVVALEVDEETNRIRIGVADLSAVPAVRNAATDLAVPVEMISFWQTPAIQELSMPVETPRIPASRTLNGPVPDGKLQGGYQVQAVGRGPCTLGFTALRAPGPHKVFVSNSHCSARTAQLDHGDWTQPNVLHNVVGTEIVDPSTHWCWNVGLLVLPIPWKCRHSDAALMSVTTDIALGMIGRTTMRSNCESCEAPREINPTNPTIEITGYRLHNVDNETLHKIGSVTGWTYGAVESTCVDVLGGDGRVRECNDLVDFSAKPGDSGSPVFAYNEADSTAQLRGIVWGGVPWPWADAAISDLHQVTKDLGHMWPFDPGPPYIAVIEGPDVVPPDAWCTWTAHARTMTPFTYVWSGVLASKAGGSVQGTVRESGWLKVHVTDLLSRSVQDSIYVELEEEEEGGPPIGQPLPPGCRVDL